MSILLTTCLTTIKAILLKKNIVKTIMDKW